MAIAALTTLAWFIAVVSGMNGRAALQLGFIPASFLLPVMPYPAAPAFLTPLTATLVHASLLHLAFNMLIFVWCGQAVERVLGRGSLILLYVIGAYAAAAAQFGYTATLPHNNVAWLTPMIGASGAVSAIMGAFSLSFGRAKQVTSSARLNRWINVAWLFAAWVVLQAMMGWAAGGQGYLLATPAHIGGFLAGLLLQRPLLLWRYRKA
jgi:membrane associated rhomboid family serine protease